MTAKEAADLIREKILPCVTGDWKEAADMAISALSNATQHSQHVETVGSDKPTDNQSVKQTDFADCLINKINSWIATGDYSIGEVNIMRCVIAELEDLPTVEPERWIPCSERLPEKSGLYLTWMRWPYEEEPTHTIINYDADVEAFGEWRERYHPETLGYLDSEFEEIENVAAWMPLPDPYRAERSGDEDD